MQFIKEFTPPLHSSKSILQYCKIKNGAKHSETLKDRFINKDKIGNQYLKVKYEDEGKSYM